MKEKKNGWQKECGEWVLYRNGRAVTGDDKTDTNKYFKLTFICEGLARATENENADKQWHWAWMEGILYILPILLSIMG